MSAFEQRKELRKLFLRAVYELSEGRPGKPIALEQVAAEMQHFLDTSIGSAFVDELDGIAKYLGDQGWIKKQTTSYGVLSITSDGVDEVERGETSEFYAPISQTSAPINGSSERREQRRRFLKAIYDLSGSSPNQFVYWRNVAPRLGWEADNQTHLEEALGIAEYFEGSRLITIEANEGTIYKITPAGIDLVENDEQQFTATSNEMPNTPDEFSDAAAVGEAPVEIQESLRRFRQDHPDSASVAFIMMRFGQTRAHNEITEAIRDGLDMRGIKGVRADDKRYHDDLFYNVLTYMHGCGLGIAVFERIEVQAYNPNVALEVGYLFAMRKPVCLLKDRTLETLQADLVGRLYDEFDPQDPAATIPLDVQKWLADKGL